MGGSLSQEELDTELWVACEVGDEAAVQKLLKLNANPNARDARLNTALHKSARHGHHAVVRLLLASCKDIQLDAVNSKGNTPALLACRGAHLEVVRSLIEFGCNIHVANHQAQTLVHIATKLGALELLEFILEKGGNVYTPNWLGLTPLHTAVVACNAAAVSLILRYKPNVDALSLEIDEENNLAAPAGSSMTPLIMAVQQRSVEIINLLLDAAANPNLPSARGWTPLHLAVILGFQDAVDSLLLRARNQAQCFWQVDLNVEDEDGNTPLHYAVQRQSLSLVTSLLRAGAATNRKNKFDQCPIHFFNGNIALCEVLIEYGTPLNVVSSSSIADQKQTPLLIACSNSGSQQDIQVVQLLLNSKADANVCSHTQLSPLHVAVSNGNLHMVELLLQNHARTDIIEMTDGLTALHFAVQLKSLPLVRALLRAGSDVNLLGSRANSVPCVYFSVVLNQNEILVELLSHGAAFSQITWSSADGMTSFQVAAANGNYFAIRAILECYSEHAGVLLATCTRAGQTPLLLAAQAGSILAVKLLIDASASAAIDTLDTADLQQNSPIHCACVAGQIELVRMLIEAGANLNLLSANNKSPLTLCMENNRLEVAELLLSAGADLSGSNHPDGITPLHIAASLGLTYLVRRLLALGADPNAPTRGSAYGVTPLLSACLGAASVDVVKLLSEYGANTNCTAIIDGYSVTPLMVAIMNESSELINWFAFSCKESIENLPEEMRESMLAYFDRFKEVDFASPPASPPRPSTLLPLSRKLAAIARSFSSPGSPLDSPPASVSPAPVSPEPTFRQTHKRGPSRTLSVGQVDSGILSELSFDRKTRDSKADLATQHGESASEQPPVGSPHSESNDIGDMEFDDVIIHSTDDEAEEASISSSSLASPGVVSDEDEPR